MKIFFFTIYPLDCGGQVRAMAEDQELFDIPPAPKLNVYGKLNPRLAARPELRGEDLFDGEANCAVLFLDNFFFDNSYNFL